MARDNHHPEFDMYAIAPPDGDWSYLVDDHGIAFGPGWWPFYREGQPASVRLSPDTQLLSWRNEYVMLHPVRGLLAVASLRLFLRKQGLGAMVAPCLIHFNLKEFTYAVDPCCEPSVLAQAEGKAERIVRLLRAARSQRRRAAPAPITASEHFAKHRD